MRINISSVSEKLPYYFDVADDSRVSMLRREGLLAQGHLQKATR